MEDKPVGFRERFGHDSHSLNDVAEDGRAMSNGQTTELRVDPSKIKKASKGFPDKDSKYNGSARETPTRKWLLAGTADILQILAFLLILNCVASLGVTRTLTWGISPRKVVTQLMTRQHVFEPEELLLYSGKMAKKPIYLAIKGEVYDVSSGRRFYGLDGDYHALSGKDASRAFATGCFQETSLTHDLRGLTPEEYIELDRWHDFFKNHRDYFRVGTVNLPAIDTTFAVPQACPPPDWENHQEDTVKKESDEPSDSANEEIQDQEHAEYDRKPSEKMNEKDPVIRQGRAHPHGDPAVKGACPHQANAEEEHPVNAV